MHWRYGEYLRRLDHDVFACSNASLLLPLYEDVSTNSTDISDSRPGVFALQEVTRIVATPTSIMTYYPVSLGTREHSCFAVVIAKTSNLAARYREVGSDGTVLLGGLVVFASFLGYVCGKRILRLRRDAQAATQTSPLERILACSGVDGPTHGAISGTSRIFFAHVGTRGGSSSQVAFVYVSADCCTFGTSNDAVLRSRSHSGSLSRTSDYCIDGSDHSKCTWIVSTACAVVAIRDLILWKAGAECIRQLFDWNVVGIELLLRARTLWSMQSPNPASALPSTMPLVVVCDVVLSRFASTVTVLDHFVLTHLAAQNWEETVVHGPRNFNRLNNSSISSASPLDDSHCRRHLSSALLSSVSL
ncbi:unnamed protein product [Peronospora destructor]|uniref:Uncharacterized protein n=1 Tax=Peronospora destructor TaxID=86335 RepID=A0AAV0UYA7_9STRA|nr:unnamed protein product [Peronospora destructor]